MAKLIKRQITQRILIATILFILTGFIISCLGILSVYKQYIIEVSDMTLDFVELTINADDAKNYITTRNIDENYNTSLELLKKYAEKNRKNIKRISVISYSNSMGYYIYDTGGNKIGTKLKYGEYEYSIKAELINGRNEWKYNKGKTVYSYRPMRTIDDRLAGYIITEIDNTIYLKHITISIIIFMFLLGTGIIFVKFLTRMISKEIFIPIQNLSKTALDFTGSISNNININTDEIFLINKDNEIGYLGKAIQKMVSDINSSTENLSRAIYDSTHDAMTQVFNKRHYNNMIPIFKESSSICVIYFDVNNLKLMNDTLGHEHGDYVIKRASEYIQQFTNESSFCFRMGGDEFLLIINNYETFNEISRIIEKLDNDSPYILSPEEDSIKCALSYGYDYAKGSFSYEKLLANAEDNMYIKKSELKKLLNMPDR